MSHKAIESVAIQPHNIEAARVDTLMPEQLRDNASNFLNLLTEYYNYMNIDGVVNGLNIIVDGTPGGEELGYDDLNASDTRLGLDVTGFVPSTYNQTYVKLTDEEILVGAYPASQVYRGISDDSYFIMRVDTKEGREVFRDAWVLASRINNTIVVDFYDEKYQEKVPNGSRTNNLDQITFRENVGGSLTSTDSTQTSAAYTEGKINSIALTKGDIPVETTLINFTDMPTRGGHGQDLTVDLVVDNGKVASIIPNKPGFGYRMDDSIILDNKVLEGTIYSIGEVIASPSNVVRRILDEHDIDKTTEDYLSRIAKEIAANIPEAKNLDRNYLYKKIVEYYATRGSQDSIQSFFKIFFDVPASVRYPKDVLFKPSDGNYQGTSSVSESLEKYFYKKGYDNARRIHFYEKAEYNSVTKGTYFIDFEFGDTFKRNAIAPATITNTNQQNAYKLTPLFSGQLVSGTELSYNSMREVGIAMKINSDGDLNIQGRFGHHANSFSTTYEDYVTGSNEFPFIDEINKARKRIRLAISVDISDSTGLQAGAIKISMTNSGETDNAPITESSSKMTLSSNAPSYTITLYPGAIGQTKFDGSVGDQSFIPDNQNPDGEYYVYTFAFVNRLATDAELKGFVNNNSLPTTNKIVDIDLDNNGSVNFTNKFDQVFLAKQIQGVIANGTGEENTGSAPLIDTNYGLSSTGSAYPRKISWRGVKGFLSDEIKLHDSDYYQEFSYVIRTELSVDRWQTEYQKLIHPAGLKFFTALYLELASRRFDSVKPPNIDVAQGIQEWLPAIQQTVDIGSHSPKWQPGWLEYLFNVLIEIIIYEQYSYRALLQQSAYNNLKDIFYDHDNSLRIKQFSPGTESDTTEPLDGFSGFTLSGNTKNAIINNVNEEVIGNTRNVIRAAEKYIILDGNGTGIKTEGKIDKSSILELSFKLLESGDIANGKYVAGCKYRGQDGHDREISIKQIKDSGSKKRVKVLVTDNAAQATDAQKLPLNSFRVIGTQGDVDTQEHGVFFSDTEVEHVSGSGNGDSTYNFNGQGHNLIAFDPSTKKYEAFHFNTQTTSDSAALANEKALVRKIREYNSTKILIIYTFAASSCRIEASPDSPNDDALRNYISENSLTTSDGSSDSTSVWKRRRVAQVLVIRRGVLSGGKDLIYEKLEDKDLSSEQSVTNQSDTNKQQVPVELSFQYDTSANLIRGPHIGIRKNSIAQPVIGGVPVTIECSDASSDTSNPLGFTKLKIGANGQIEQYNYDTENYEIKRSELEASDPKHLNELNLSGYDWEYLTETLLSTNNATFSNGTSPAAKGGSSGYYYDEAEGGLITMGGPRWIRIKTSTIIDQHATYTLDVDIRNLSTNKRVSFVIGHIDLDGINGNPVSTDTFNTNLRNTLMTRTLNPGSRTNVRDGRVSFGGYNPRSDSFINQSTADSRKFDPGATHFDLFIVANYFDYTTEDPNTHDAFFVSKPNERALVIESIKLTKTGGNNIIENHNITKVDPNFGFNKIATSSLPIVPKRFSVAANNLTFPNTLAIGTLNEWTGGSSNPKLAGVHELDRSSDLANDLLKTQQLLPLRAGKLTNFNPISDTKREWNHKQTIAGQVQRIYSTGPFGNREVVYAANPDNNVSGTSEIGFNSGAVNIDRLKDYRISCFFKLTGSGTNTKFKFGFNAINDNRNAKNTLRKKQFQTQTTLGGTLQAPFFNNVSNTYSTFSGQTEKWYYIQGYVTGFNSNTNGNPNNNSLARYVDKGIYDIETGAKLDVFIDEFLFNSDEITRLNLCFFINENGDGFSNQGFEVARTRIDEVGSAGYPSVSDLLQVNERSRFSSNLQVSEIFLGGEKENSIKHLITETDQVGNTFDRITADSPNHNPIPATESSTSYTPISYSAAKEESVTLKDIMAGGGGDAKLLSVTGIKSFGGVDGSHRQTNEMTSLFNIGERFSLMTNDLDANLTTSTRDFTIANSAGADKTSEVSGVELEAFYGASGDTKFATFRIIKQGIGLDEFDVITIPKAKLGLATTADDVTIKVNNVGKGTFTLEQNSLSNSNENKMYLTRASNDSPSTLGLGGGFTTDKFEWEKDKAYEISFNATKIFDRNTPANLYIGADKIGYFSDLSSVAGGSVGNATGNPNALLDGRADNQDGDGPQEFIFDSSIEGRCRIFLFISDAEGSFRLAHNGHQLRVDNTNSDQITRVRIPDDYWNRGTTKLAKIAEDNEANAHADAVRSDSAGLFVFESEFLNVGENIIQLYCLGGDGVDGNGYIYVQPADNGLITEGANTHKIYIPNSGDGRIVIDHKIDRDVSRTFGGNSSILNKIQEDEKLYEYNWKLENIKVREKRKRVYNGNFRCVVADPASGIFTGGNNTDPLFGTPSYRPVDISTPAATDGAIGFGGTLIVPALVDRTLDADADVGQEYTTGTIGGRALPGNAISLPVLGVPKGKYGVLRLEASNLGQHYISIGDDYAGTPFVANGLFTPGETYEISGYVYIPSANSKIEHVHVMAGINPIAIDASGNNILDAGGNLTFTNAIGKNQVLAGPLAGYDVYGGEETVVSTKGSWQYFNHTFIGPSFLDDEFPVIRFVGTLKGETLRGLDGYTGDASGEFFYIKNIVIKEGFDTDSIKEKNSFDDVQKSFIDTKDNVEYDLAMNAPATNREACVAIDLKHPADSNTYKLRTDDQELVLGINLSTLPLRDSNLLSSYLPFTTINTATNTPVDGQALGYYNGAFQPLGNPTSVGHSTFQSTLENEIIVGESPFGGSERIWRAKNKDGAWAQLSTITRNAGGNSYQVTYSNIDNTTYSQPDQSYSAVEQNSTNGSGGVGANSAAQFDITKNTTGYTVTLVSSALGEGYTGPIQYGQNSTLNTVPYTQTVANVGSASGAKFHVRRVGALYEVDLINGGSNYSVGDSIDVAGTDLDGTSTTNDLLINVTEVNGSGTITKIDSSGNGVFNANSGETLRILGTQLGGTSPANDLLIKITAVNGDSESTIGEIISFTVSGTPAMVNDIFEVIRKGSTYTVNRTTTGSGYKLLSGDVSPSYDLVVPGDKLGGAAGAPGAGGNDLTISITNINGDGIATTFSSSGTADNVYDDVPIEDTQAHNAGVGAKASLEISDAGVVQSSGIVVTNGGIAYGRNSSSGTYMTTGIPVTISSGYFSAGSGFTGIAAMHASLEGGALSIDTAGNDKPISLPDGGFRTPFVNVDPSRTYRCSVWIRQSDVRYGDGIVPFELTDGGHKRFRWTGHNANGDILPSVNITSQKQSSDPSFVEDFDVGPTSTSQSSIAGNKANENKWFLVVGHIRPFDYTGTTDHPDSGVYSTTKDGQKVKALPTDEFLGDWKFTIAMKKIKMTAIQIANPLGEEHPVDFYAPRIDELNGLEPTIAELTSGDVKYKLREEDTEKKLQIVNWNTPINDITEPLGDYHRAIEGDDFSISIDEVVDNIEYADKVNSTFDLTIAPKSTLIEIELPATSSDANKDVIMLPFQKISSISPATHGISIDWGDNTSDFANTTESESLYHKYTLTSSVQRITIKVQGTFNKFNSADIDSSGPQLKDDGTSPTPNITVNQLSASRNNFKSYVRKIYLGSSPMSQPSSGQGFSLRGCTGLEQFISVKGVTNTTSLTTFEKTFKGCSNLKHIDVRGIDTSNATSLVEMFALGLEVQLRTNGAFQNTRNVVVDTGGVLNNDSADPLNALAIGDRIYYQSITGGTGDQAAFPVRTIASLSGQGAGTTQVNIGMNREGRRADNALMRFIKPVTGVKMIGLHTFNISSLEKGKAKGMNHMLRGVTINSDEVSRCIVAWANDTYGTSPSATSGAAADDKLRFDFGTSKFFTGPQFDDLNDTSSTPVVSDALTILTGTKNWLSSFNVGDTLPIAETGASDTFDF